MSNLQFAALALLVVGLLAGKGFWPDLFKLAGLLVMLALCLGSLAIVALFVVDRSALPSWAILVPLAFGAVCGIRDMFKGKA